MLKSSWLFTPTLSFIGIQQAIQLGDSKEFKDIVKMKNVFITSATVRTIMTAFLSLKSNSSITSIIVVPFINEHENIAGDFDLDNANRSISPDIIDLVIKQIKMWLVENKVVNQDNDSNIPINTDFYKEMCVKYADSKPLGSNITLFKNNILQELYIKSELNNKPMNIIAYSHGYVISQLLKLKPTNYTGRFHPNVSIFRETSKDIQNIMNGVYIRSNGLEQTLENDRSDEQRNVCSLNSLRGNINKIIIENIKSKGGCKKKSLKKRKYNKTHSKLKKK